MKSTTKITLGLMIFLFVCILSFNFINSPGAGDMDAWIKWTKNADKYGLVQGFYYNQDMYPPLASVILFVTYKAKFLLNVDPITGIKLSLFLFLIVASAIFYYWKKDFLFASLAMLSFSLNTILGYIDIYTFPTLILSFLALSKKKYVLFSVLFTLTCLIKMQPLIIAPFLIIYLLDFRNVNDLKHFDWKEFIKKLALPSILIFSLIVGIYGIEVISAFSRATDNPHFSGQALNFNWIITYFLRAFHYFGSLKEGYIKWIITEDLRIVLASQNIIFWVLPCNNFLVYQRRKDF